MKLEKLTSYVLGELDGDGVREVEELLDADPEARRTVEELRRTARISSEALEAEPRPGLTSEQREAIASRARVTRGRPAMLWWAGAAAAVVVALLTGTILTGRFMLRRAAHEARNQVAASEEVLTRQEMEWEAAPAPASVAIDGKRRKAAVDDTVSGLLALEEATAEADKDRFFALPLAVDTPVAAQKGGQAGRDDTGILALINRLSYSDAASRGPEALSLVAEVAGCPWNPDHRLLRIMLTARQDGEPPAIVATGVTLEVVFDPEAVENHVLVGHGEAGPTTGTAAQFLAGQSVTVLFEIVPTDVGGDPGRVELGFTAAGDDEQSRVTLELSDSGTDWKDASEDFRLSAAAAAYGLVQSDSPHKGSASHEMALEIAPGDELAPLVEQAGEVQ